MLNGASRREFIKYSWSPVPSLPPVRDLDRVMAQPSNGFTEVKISFPAKFMLSCFTGKKVVWRTALFLF